MTVVLCPHPLPRERLRPGVGFLVLGLDLGLLWLANLYWPLQNVLFNAAPLVEMNTTPLIDVLLVLIVMLIITSPVPLHSVNLDMPSRQATTTAFEVVVLQIDAKGFVVWGGDRLASMADVNARIAAAAAQSMQPEIQLQPSPDAPYAFVAGVLVLAKKAGLIKVGVAN